MTRICAHPHCDKPGASRYTRPGQRKWCNRHCNPRYRELDMSGEPPVNKRTLRRPLGERFWEKVDRRDLDECWAWLASLNDAGYGQFMIDKGDGWRPYRAHRISYEFLREPIPDGLVLDHLCRNRWCVNPWHLEAVTHKTNIQRGMPFKAPIVNTHCPSGHEYTPENTRIAKDGYKRCRLCERRDALAGYYRNRAPGTTRERTACAHCGRDVAIHPNSRQFANHMVRVGCLFGCCITSDTCPGSLRTRSEAARVIANDTELRVWKRRAS